MESNKLNRRMVACPQRRGRCIRLLLLYSFLTGLCGIAVVAHSLGLTPANISKTFYLTLELQNQSSTNLSSTSMANVDNSSRCNMHFLGSWTAKILHDFSISCGVYSLKDMACQVSQKQIQMEVDHYIKVSQTVHRLYKIFWASIFKIREFDSLPRSAGPQVKVEESPERKSLAFIKTFKVGGTHMSTLLNTYSYVYDLNIDPFTDASGGTLFKNRYNRTCVDVAGTDHPPPYFYTALKSRAVRGYFCRDVVPFMLVRDPVKRIWSAYNHYTRVYEPNSTLQDFLLTQHEVLTPPHRLFSHSVEKASQFTQDITILSQDDNNMDRSLVMLAQKAGLSLCDILYEPCKETGNDWEINKCNERKSRLDSSSAALITDHVNSTGEQRFYDRLIPRFHQEISDPGLQKNLEIYLRMKEDASSACSTVVSIRAWKNLLFADPKVKLVFDSGTIRFSIGVGSHINISPSWVCMQFYCQEKINLY